MYTFITKRLPIIIALTFLCTAFMSLAPTPYTPSTEVSSGWADYFATIAGMVSLITIAVGVIKKIIPIKGIWVQIVSWVLSAILSIIGFLLKLGMYADFAALSPWLGWLSTLGLAVAIGLAANGFADTKFMSAIYDRFTLTKAERREKKQARKALQLAKEADEFNRQAIKQLKKKVKISDKNK